MNERPATHRLAALVGAATIAMAALLATLLGAPAPRRAHAQSASGITPLGSDFEITGAASSVGVPSTCARPGGGFVVVRSEGAPGAAQVMAERIDAQGNPEGTDFVVSTYAGGHASDPDVACGGNGGFAIVWTDRLPLSVENDGTLDDDVLARVFDAAGNALDDPFRVNSHTTGNQAEAAVCALADGGFAVAWRDRNRDEVDARVIAEAAPASEAEQVAENPRPEMPPDVGCSGDGKFLVVWGAFPSPEVNDEVAARLFSSDGVPAGTRFFVNGFTTGDQGYPVVCSSPDTGFVVSWRDATNRRAPGRIKARRVSSSGMPVGAGFDVSPEGRDRSEITCGAQQSFVVTTHATDEGAEALYAQAVDPEGELVGAEGVVDDGATTLDGLAPPVAGDGAGRFLVAWPSVVTPDSQSIRGRLFRVGEGAEPTTTTTVGQPTTTTVVTPTTTSTVPTSTECGDVALRAGAIASKDRARSRDLLGAEAAIAISDALAVLRAAVAGDACEPCRCDTDGSGTITVQDALRVLRLAVGLAVELDCPPCS